MITLVGGEKGGTGKTLLCVNIACLRALTGRKVVIVDADPQGTAVRWVLARRKNEIDPGIECRAMSGGEIGPDIVELDGRFDDVLVDCGGKDSLELRAAATVADFFLIPVKPAQFDMWTLERTGYVYLKAKELNPKLRGGVVVNMAPSNTKYETRNAVEELQLQRELPFTEVVIHDRVVYRRSQIAGAGIFEVSPEDDKAQLEMEELYKVIYGEALIIKAQNETRVATRGQ